jgi:hypothetical protein
MLVSGFNILVDTISKALSAKQTKYMLLYCDQNARQNHDMKIADRSLGNVHFSNIWERQ